MKLEQLKTILNIISQDNPKNYYINNNGLSELGRILFYPRDNEKLKQTLYKKEIEQTFPDTSQKIYDSLMKYHFSSYYTDKDIIDFQINILKKNNISPKRILEPSAGNGAYVHQLKKAFPDAEIIALEPDVLSYSILKANNKQQLKNEAKVTCINSTFEDYFLNNRDNPSFDLVISNVPFGSFKIKQSFKHNYISNNDEFNINAYFNRYASELLVNNGISMILTSKTFLDAPHYNKVRLESLEYNNLIDVLRFNNELFKNEKTKVVTDLIIYQRDYSKTEKTGLEEQFLKTTTINIDNKEFNVNQFIDSNKDRINGDYKAGVFHQTPDLTIIPNDETLDVFLEKKINNIIISDNKQITKTTLEPTVTASERASEESHEQEKEHVKVINLNEKKETTITNDTVKNEPITFKDTSFIEANTSLYKNSYNINNGVPYYYISRENYTPVSPKNALLLNSYVSLRNDIVLLKENSLRNLYDNSTIASKLTEIKYNLDLFHFQYGFLNENDKLLSKDSYFDTIRELLEQPLPNNKYKISPRLGIDYFKSLKEHYISNDPQVQVEKAEHKTVQTVSEFHDAKTLKELAYEYFDKYGKLDLEHISEIYGQAPEQILKEAFEDRIFYENPIFENGRFLEFRTELFFLVESGNIERKIEAFKNHKTKYDINHNSILNYYESIKNEKLDIDQIEFNFESSFIPLEAKIDFFKEHLNEPIEPIILQFQSSIELKYTRAHNTQAEELYTVNINNQRLYGYKKILSAFANNKFPVVTYTITDADGKKKTFIHKDATLDAQNKYQALQLEFKSFIKNNALYRKTIEDNYYNNFLTDRNLKTDPNILKFPKTLAYKPYDHQNSSVLFGLMNGTGLFDHKVGHGKTLSMGMLASKLIQHKKNKRIFLMTLKSVSSQLHKEIGMNFPNIKTFLLNDSNFNKSKRAETLNKIKNDPSIQLIIGEHTYLKSIPKHEDFVSSTFNDNIAMVDQDMETAKKYGLQVSKGIIKGLVKRKENLEKKLEDNLAYHKSNLVEGVPYFEDLGIDCLMIDESHKFKNIAYSTRHDRVSGLNTSKGAKQNLDLEISIRSIHERTEKDKNIYFYTGTPLINSVTEVYALQRYLTPFYLKEKNLYNFDAWASVFLKQSVQTESDILGNPKQHTRFRYFTNLPELSKLYNSFTHISDDNTYKPHKITTKSEFKILEPTQKFKELKEKTLDFTKNLNQKDLFGFDRYDDKQLKASHILGLQVNRSALVDPILEMNKGLNVEFSKEDQIKLQTLCKDAYDVYEKSKKDKGVVLIFSDIGVYKPNEYNTYTEMGRILHEVYGIPKNEIAYAQEQTSNNKMNKFQNDIRNGDVRIAIGSTQKLGTGTNIQKRVLAVLHLDIPYSPEAYDQRLGRAERAGNELIAKYGNTLIENFYGMKDTSDIFSFSLNKHKQVFRKQIKYADPNVRIFDDALGDKESLSYSQMEAALIGDMDAFKMNKLKADRDNLDQQKKMYDISKNNASKKIEKFANINNKIVAKVNLYRKAEASLKDLIPKYDENTPISTIKNKTVESYHKATFLPEYIKSYDDLSKHLHDRILSMGINQGEIKLLDFNVKGVGGLYLKRKYNPALEKDAFNFYLNFNNTQITGKSQYKFDNKKLPYQLFKIIRDIPRKIKDMESDINFNSQTININKKLLNQSFPKDKLIKLDQLNKEIKTIKQRKLG